MQSDFIKTFCEIKVSPANKGGFSAPVKVRDERVREVQQPECCRGVPRS